MSSEGLDVRAVRRIGEVWLRLDSADLQLKEARKAWREKIAAAMAALRGAVEADDDGTAASARAKLDDILEAYQNFVEAESGMKMEVHELRAEVAELRKKMRLQVEGAKQLGLFDDDTEGGTDDDDHF